MKYNLWDTETSHYLGQFEDETEALTLVRTLISRFGKSYAEVLSLGRVTDEGDVLEPLSGLALIARVDAVLADAQRMGGRKAS
jgi:hypothetical protein